MKLFALFNKSNVITITQKDNHNPCDAACLNNSC